jgi:hypothetical protein
MKIVSRDVAAGGSHKPGTGAISLRTHTLDGGFEAIHQELNTSERSAMTTGYVEW